MLSRDLHPALDQLAYRSGCQLRCRRSVRAPQPRPSSVDPHEFATILTNRAPSSVDPHEFATILTNDMPGDTLSEHVRKWFSVHTKIGRTVFLGVWLFFTAWFLLHILTKLF